MNNGDFPTRRNVPRVRLTVATPEPETALQSAGAPRGNGLNCGLLAARAAPPAGGPHRPVCQSGRRGGEKEPGRVGLPTPAPRPTPSRVHLAELLGARAPARDAGQQPRPSPRTHRGGARGAPEVRHPSRGSSARASVPPARWWPRGSLPLSFPWAHRFEEEATSYPRALLMGPGQMKNYKPPKCPSLRQWLGQRGIPHTMKCYVKHH